MEKGSLVKLKYDDWPRQPEDEEIFPIKGIIYTVREVVLTGDRKLITLEEIINPKYNYLESYSEMKFDSLFFEELLPPINVEELLKSFLTI